MAYLAADGAEFDSLAVNMKSLPSKSPNLDTSKGFHDASL